MCNQGFKIFEETQKLVQDVIVHFYCPDKFCFNREKCETLDNQVNSPISIYARGKSGAWLLVYKVPVTLQEHINTTKTDKTCF